MKQLFVSFTFLCFSLLSQTHLHLCIHLFWRVNQMAKNRRRFVSKVGHLWYFMGLSRRISVKNRSPFCPYETSPHCFA